MGFIYLFFFLVMLPSEIPKLPTDPPVRGSPGVWKLLRLPPQDGPPSLTLLSLFLSFVFVLPPFEDNGLPFWVPGVLRHIQKLFCGIFSVFKCSFDEFVGEKVVSLSYSLAILGPPLELMLLNCGVGDT